MLTLAPLRYRSILAQSGGPVESIELTPFPVSGRAMIQANATLVAGLVPVREARVYSAADGTGTGATAAEARFKAVSEALERWAYYAKVEAADRELYGFDQDPTSSGMAAFPGLTHHPARRNAVWEAVERTSVFGWWEGVIDAQPIDSGWPGIRAFALPSPIGTGVTVVVYRRTAAESYAYGHAAAAAPEEACNRAVTELARHEYAVRRFREAAPDAPPANLRNLLERRALFFSSEAGYALFEERLCRPPKGRRFVSRIVCDTEVFGPWSSYATVWRVVIEPPSHEFLTPTERYFFW